MGLTGPPRPYLLLCAIAFSATWPSFASQVEGRTELTEGWKLISASKMRESGAKVSQSTFNAVDWLPIKRMPATVLEILQENDVYPNLYFGMNLLTEPPQDLYKQDWWYRTSFEAPSGKKAYWLELPGINYRAEVWLNGKLIANSRQLVGMYVGHEFNVTDLIHPGEPNVLAIRVTPERAIPNVSGVELADSWHDWLDWKFLGSKAPPSDHYKEGWTADRNAGVWKPVYLHSTGAVKVSDAVVNTDLPLPSTDSASLSIYTTLSNGTAATVSGVLVANVSRTGKSAILVRSPVSLNPGEVKEITFSPERFPQLAVDHPDLWWPYTMGNPNLYDLHVEFKIGDKLSDGQSIQFGVRKVTQHRDSDLRFSKTREGNFYFQVNGKDFLVRGADYTPDLLFRSDRRRNADNILYVKDLGLNMLRWEAKIADENMFELADQAGIPVMVGWMCCSKWEQWNQWSAEDQEIARQSLRSQILMLRSHGSAFLWSSGSDGLPPDPLRADYRRILAELHWQNAVVDTDANGNRDAHGNQIWDGIGMFGVDRWHPPSYWFDPKYPASGGSSAEYGDNEVIPPYESLKKFIPQDKLWPMNEYWFFHAGAHEGANQLAAIRAVVERRYGKSNNAEEFANKAQLAHYETTRAQFEAWSSDGWATHKMEMYWMLNNHWPSFFGHLYDYYMEPGGGYFGAKKALRPLSIVFDYYSAKPHRSAKIRITNQTMSEQRGLRVRVRIYDLDSKIRYDQQAADQSVPAQGITIALTMPRPKNITPVYFVRCELLDSAGRSIVDNVYWQSTTLDDFGNPRHDDDDYVYTQASWSTFLELNAMPKVKLDVTSSVKTSDGRSRFSVALRNGTQQIAFFDRVSITAGSNGDEVLPVLYDDNYVTVFPGETKYIQGSFDSKALGERKPWVRVEGYTAVAGTAPLERIPPDVKHP
jgi:exo-1,4-beta-D-glucosaminidase